MFKHAAVKFLAPAGLIILSLFAPSQSYAVPGLTIWESVYPGKSGSDGVYARGLALDQQGNLYIAGYQKDRDGSNNYVTLKYGPYGTLEWTREYDHSWYDVGRAVAVAPDGSVVVAGASDNLDNRRNSYSSSYYTDYRLVRYSPQGDLLAEMTASGSGKGSEPSGVTVDKAGNIYVTGYSRNEPDTASLMYTVKFDPSGKVVWEKTEDWGGDSFGTAIKAGSSRSVVVTGYFRDIDDKYSIRVLRYDARNGKTIMDVAYANSGDDEKSWGLTLDPEGDIFVTGETSRDGNVTLTLKYSPTGELLWANRYRGSYYKNLGESVAVDRFGQLYVAGRTIRPTDYNSAYTDIEGDYLLLVYDTNGKLLFNNPYRFEGDSHAEGVAADVYDNVVVTGTSVSPNNVGAIRTIRVEGVTPGSADAEEPARMAEGPGNPAQHDPACIPHVFCWKSAFWPRLAATPRPLLRHVDIDALVLYKTEGGACFKLTAKTSGSPGKCEYRFYVQGRDQGWEAVTDYNDINFVLVKGVYGKPAKAKVEVRHTGSMLPHEASQVINLEQFYQQ